MDLSRRARSRLGNLVGEADRVIAELIVERGGNAANVREAGHWSHNTLGEVAEAAASGDQSAVKALKIVKQAKRLGEAH